MAGETTGFAHWLNVTMQQHGLSQAALARTVGVADTQVSRWRRGQVLPTLRYLQQIADAFGVPRSTLDRLAGYPVVDRISTTTFEIDPIALAELQAVEARYQDILEEKIPRVMWPAYLAACDALADAFQASYQAILSPLPDESDTHRGDNTADTTTKDSRDLGFHRSSPSVGGVNTAVQHQPAE